jgi:anti-sigma regulatory factor (Ser/Thr protein kinase)
MRQLETHTARTPEPFAGGRSSLDFGPFRGLSARAPFPRSGGGAAARGPGIWVELDCGPAAAAEARAAVGALDGHADEELLDDLRLLLSEVVTNAVRHASSPREAKIGVAVSVARDSVRAEVSDSGPGFEPTPRDAPELEAGGWGLHLVDRIASRWGVDRGKSVRVWFELDSVR